MKNIQKNKKPLPECERDVEPVEESPDERAQSLLPHADGHGHRVAEGGSSSLQRRLRAVRAGLHLAPGHLGFHSHLMHQYLP